MRDFLVKLFTIDFSESSLHEFLSGLADHTRVSTEIPLSIGVCFDMVYIDPSLLVSFYFLTSRMDMEIEISDGVELINIEKLCLCRYAEIE